MLVKIAKYMVGVCVYRRSYLIWSPVIHLLGVVDSAREHTACLFVTRVTPAVQYMFGPRKFPRRSELTKKLMEGF